MRANTTAPSENKPIKIQLAKDEEGWHELKQVLDGHLTKLLACSNEESVKAFLFISDLLSNESFDADDRALAAEHVQHTAFAFSQRCSTEMERYLNELNPGRVIKRRKVAINA